jgi:hypothetical protein
LLVFISGTIRFSRYGLAWGPRRSYELITIDSTRNTKGVAHLAIYEDSQLDK